MRGDRSQSSEVGKLAYEKPQLVRIGSLENITRHAGGGGYTDQTFPGGTAYGDLQFSDLPPQ